MSFLMQLIRPIAYLSLPIVILRYISQRSPITRYYLRLCLYLSALGATALYGIFASITLALIGRPLDCGWFIGRSFIAFGGRVMGIRFEVEGEEHLSTRPAIFVGNHQSMLDILFLGRTFPQRCAVTAKKELKWSPFLGQFMTLAGTIYIDRKNNKEAIKSLAYAASTLKTEDKSIWVFAEGTRSLSYKPELLPFKKGGFHLAIQAQVPIVPVVCENYWHLYHKGTLEGGTLKIRVLPPIPTTSLTADDVGTLATKTREVMLAALVDISRKVPGTASTTKREPPSLPVSLSVPQGEEPSILSPVDSSSTAHSTAGSDTASHPTGSEESLSRSVSRMSASVNGTETDDEGMVIVRHP